MISYHVDTWVSIRAEQICTLKRFYEFGPSTERLSGVSPNYYFPTCQKSTDYLIHKKSSLPMHLWGYARIFVLQILSYICVFLYGKAVTPFYNMNNVRKLILRIAE